MSDPLTIGIGVGVVGALLVGLSQQQKTTIEVGKLSNRTFQGSEYGGDIPRVYSTVGLSGSQIVWMEKNQLKEVVKKKKSGGKGGASTVTKTYSYFATFALMLCQGEIAGIRRIWCSDKLIYNAGSDDLETIIASNQAAKGWRLYRGTDDQLPDPRYEADVGVGNAPAFRGYSYIVFDDFALADYGNTLQAAQFKVEVLSKTGVQNYVVISSETSRAGGINVYGSGIDGVGDSGEWRYCSLNDGVLSQFSQFTSGAVSVDSEPTGYDLFRKEPIGGVFTGAFPFGCITADGERRHFRAGNTLYGVPGNTAISLSSGFVVDDDLFGLIDGTLYRLAGTDAGFDSQVVASVALGPNENGVCLQGERVYLKSGTNQIKEFDLDLNLRSQKTISGLAPGFAASPFLFANDDFLFYVTGSTGLFNLFKIDYQAGAMVESYLNIALPFAPLQISIDRNLIAFCGQFADAETSYLWREVIEIDKQVEDYESLADVLQAECIKSALIKASDLDTSLLTQSIRGYRVSGGAIRSVIEPLQGAYPFDVVPSGYQLKFVPRGQASVLSIPWEDLAAANGDEIGDMLSMPREMDTQLPHRVSITALSSTREYASSTQYYERLNTSAVNVEERDIPLVLSDDEIAQMAEKLLFLRWLERTDASFSLPPSYLGLEPADVVTVTAPYGIFELRLAEVNYEADGRLTCKARPNNAAIYTSTAVGAVVPGPDGTIPLRGPSLWVAMDIPLIDETLQNTPGMATAASGYTDGWPGMVLVRSNDDGQTYTDLQAYVGKCTIGYAQGSLPANSGALIDQRTLSVGLVSGELESVTEEQMLAGANIAAYGADQRWEIIRFQNAVLQPDGSYVLSQFVRGDRGTEWATGLHQPGDQFILLDDPDNAFVGLPVESIGLQRMYRAVTSGASIDSAPDQPFTYRGVNLRPLSPAYPVGMRNGAGDLVASWTRRSRLSSSWWVTGISAPVGETSEAYEVEVMSGATVKRTISATTPTINYPAVDQIADFGSAQAAITLRIYQLSSVVGRGLPLEVTL